MAAEGGAADRSTRPESIPLPTLLRHRALRRLGLAVLGVLVGAGALNLLGMRAGDAEASQDGVSLSVTYAVVTRSGLETPWSVTVRSPGGFPGPVTISTSAEYFTRFDFNQWYPEPSSTALSGDRLVMTFERPEGGALVVRFDGRASPTFGLGSEATTALETDGLPALSVSYRTVVMP